MFGRTSVRDDSPPNQTKVREARGVGVQMHEGGVCRVTPTVYIYITLHLDVWFLLLTVSGGLVCFVTVGGVYVYAVE